MPDRHRLAATLDAPIGPLTVLARGDALVSAGFTGDPGELHARLRRCAAAAAARRGVLPSLVEPLRDYFDGDLAALDRLPVHSPDGVAGAAVAQQMRAVCAPVRDQLHRPGHPGGHPGGGPRRRRPCEANLDRAGRPVPPGTAPDAASAATTPGWTPAVAAEPRRGVA